MQLLLLLSALLSTLTGALTGARAPEMQLHRSSVESSVASAPLAVTRETVRLRPQQPVANFATVAGMPAGSIAWAVAAAIPLYADRLRE